MKLTTDHPGVMDSPDQRQEDLKLLSSALSHDLEGSVRGVKSLAVILLSRFGTQMDEEGRAMVRLLSSEAERANRLLDGLQDWVTYARHPLHMAWQDTTRIAREAFGIAMKATPDRQIAFDLPTLPSVWSDEIVLRKALHELLANAVKFTGQQASPQIALSAEDVDGETVLTVRDNGAGFEIEHSTQLFKLFRRMHRKQEFPGEGAGLAVVREIMQRHGGRVWTEAKVDEGAAFHLAFPRPVEGESVILS